MLKKRKNRSFNFSISERKVLLLIIDNAIALVGLYVYNLLISGSIVFLFYLSVGFFLSYNLILNGIFKTYNLQIASSSRKLHLILFVYLISFSIYFLTPGITPSIPAKRILVLYLIILLPLSITIWRYFYIVVIHQPVLYTNTLIFGIPECISFIKEAFPFEKNTYRIVNEKIVDERNPLDGKAIQEFREILSNQRINTVILAYDNLNSLPAEINEFIELCSLKRIEVYDYLKFYEAVQNALPLSRLGKNLFWYLPFTRANYNLIYKGVHRMIDVFFSFFGLLFFALILPLIYILNIFFNRGPLFFRQLRVGRGGDEFNLVKLRSMVTDAEKDGAKMAVKNDARVTRFGKILRKFRFDELPQFWNVMKGEMSLIGPRPERKVFVDQLSEQIPFYDMRHMVKPGITGWAQVKYKYGENLEDSYKKLEYDLYYIKNRSIILDIRIIIDTINTVIFSKGQ
ncbi:MAG: exopolysaccharide biosynthesis polyprenyl glycosylphosphotransferase [Cyclobacteriaceae bacterium]